MSTFFHSDNSPLLNQGFTTYTPNNSDPYSLYKQQLMDQYMKNQAVNTPPHDFLNDLDTLTRDLDKEVVERLNQDVRYNELNAKLQLSIQEEIKNLVKSKINANSELADNIKEEIEIINKVKGQQKEEERNNYYEMQDYLKNYSHLTYDDYKKIKEKKYRKETEE